MKTSVAHTDLARAQKMIISLQAANENCADRSAKLVKENKRLEAALQEKEIEWERYQQAHPSESS